MESLHLFNIPTTHSNRTALIQL